MADTRKHVGLSWWVGACTRCGKRRVVHTTVLYTDGARMGWGTGAIGYTGVNPAVNGCDVPACKVGYSEVADIRPLMTLAEQEPYIAAHALGGWFAVVEMIGV